MDEFSRSEAVSVDGITSVEVGVMTPDGSSFPDEEELRIVWGEECILGLFVAVLRSHEELLQQGDAAKLSKTMKSWAVQLSSCPMKWHAKGPESTVMLNGS